MGSNTITEMNTPSAPTRLLVAIVLNAALWGVIGYGQGMWSVANGVLMNTKKVIRDYPSRKEWSDAVKNEMLSEGLYSRALMC